MDDENWNEGANEKVEGKPDQTALTIYVGLYEQGYKVGADEGGKKPDPKTEERLRAHAASAANCLTAAPYDPEHNQADRHLEDQREHLKDQRRDFEEQVENGVAAVRDFDQKRASIPKPKQPGEIPYLLGTLCSVSVAATIAPTLHDVFFAKLFEDRVDALLASGAAGVLFAAGIVFGTLSTAKHKLQAWVEWVGMAVAFLFGAAFLFLRLSGAPTESDRLVAYGLALLEVVALSIVEVKVRGLRREWEIFHNHTPAYAVATEQLDAAKGHLAGRREALTDVNRQLAVIDKRVADREHLVRSTPHLIEAAVSSILLGYQHSLVAKRGALHRGGPLELPSQREIVARLSQLPTVAGLIKKAA